MSLATDEFIGGVLLDDVDDGPLYTVDAGHRARVHEFVVANLGVDAVTFHMWLDDDPDAGRYFGGSIAGGETWFRPLGVWAEERVVRGLATVPGVIAVRASGSLLRVT